MESQLQFLLGGGHLTPSPMHCRVKTAKDFYKLVKNEMPSMVPFYVPQDYFEVQYAPIKS